MTFWPFFRIVVIRITKLSNLLVSSLRKVSSPFHVMSPPFISFQASDNTNIINRIWLTTLLYLTFVPLWILQETANLFPFVLCSHLIHTSFQCPKCDPECREDREETWQPGKLVLKLIITMLVKSHLLPQVIRKGYMAIHNLGIMKGQFLEWRQLAWNRPKDKLYFNPSLQN